MTVRLPLLTIVLCAVNGVLLYLVGAQLWRGSMRDELANAAAAQPPAAAAARPAVPAPSFDAIQSHAVFHRARSFYVPPPAPVVQQPVPDYRLAGSMSIPNRPAAAVLVNNQTNARITVAAGDQLDGWTILEVSSSRIVLDLGGRNAEITAAARAAGNGIVLTSSGQTAAPPQPGMVRVLGAQGASSPAPASVPAASSSPRLYRPPPVQQ